ncbi:MAG: DUF4954 family protein [Treponema sp.]|nr:DUF4954 family protein [Treponema sp.]
MEKTVFLPADRYGYDFVPGDFLPPGKDEYWLRDARRRDRAWRKLSRDETETLVRNGNHCRDWGSLLVSDPFDPSLVRGSSFHGLVRLGALRNVLLKFHDFCVPAGIRNSTIISCDIGDDVAIQDCSYVSHYVIGDGCILSCINEMQTTNHAKFGNGAIKDGEDESVRVWIDVMNEAGGRSILAFEDMIPADAFLWAAYRDDTDLTDRLAKITQERYGGYRGSYGTVGDRSVIKSCTIIKDVAIGGHAYIKGANKLKNLTILSSKEEPTQIGEGVELVNGIVGYGCRIFYGSKAVRFVMGRNCNLKYGARLVHSVMGDNSTVSCCEILNNLIFPMHEQHHNNSFLIASLVQGMSNMAAAATIGSNHNSRANDGEIRAKRGFWPGLAVSLKHSSCFASFVLIAKGEYPAELNIPLPFSLLSNNTYKNRLELMPAYYWVHNLYALERNSWKVRRRDQRVVKAQHIETDYLTPDTAEEIISAIAMLEGWLDDEGLSSDDVLSENLIPCRHLEHSKRGQVILRPREGIAAYNQMLRWYAVKTLALFIDERPDLDYDGLAAILGAGERVKDWVNMGGQIVPAFRVDELRGEIGGGKLGTWDEIHQVYARWQEAYPMDKTHHAWAVFSLLNDSSNRPLAGAPLLKCELAASLDIRRLISDRVYETREKDFRNAFKKATFRNAREMEGVLCPTDNDPFMAHTREEGQRYEELVARVMARL